MSGTTRRKKDGVLTRQRKDALGQHADLRNWMQAKSAAAPVQQTTATVLSRKRTRAEEEPVESPIESSAATETLSDGRESSRKLGCASVWIAPLADFRRQAESVTALTQVLQLEVCGKEARWRARDVHSSGYVTFMVDGCTVLARDAESAKHCCASNAPHSVTTLKDSDASARAIVSLRWLSGCFKDHYARFRSFEGALYFCIYGTELHSRLSFWLEDVHADIMRRDTTVAIARDDSTGPSALRTDSVAVGSDDDEVEETPSKLKKPAAVSAPAKVPRQNAKAQRARLIEAERDSRRMQRNAALESVALRDLVLDEFAPRIRRTLHFIPKNTSTSSRRVSANSSSDGDDAEMTPIKKAGARQGRWRLDYEWETSARRSTLTTEFLSGGRLPSGSLVEHKSGPLRGLLSMGADPVGRMALCAPLKFDCCVRWTCPTELANQCTQACVVGSWIEFEVVPATCEFRVQARSPIACMRLELPFQNPSVPISSGSTHTSKRARTASIASPSATASVSISNSTPCRGLTVRTSAPSEALGAILQRFPLRIFRTLERNVGVARSVELYFTKHAPLVMVLRNSAGAPMSVTRLAPYTDAQLLRPLLAQY